jgi:hypothetical protein
VRTTRAPRRARATGAVAILGVLSFSLGSFPASAATSEAALGAIVIPNLGPGYTVSSQGPLNSAQFASNAPDPSAAAGALSTLGKSISTYERVWQADGGLNRVQNLLVRFPDAVGAQVFLQAAQHSLESGEIMSSDAMPSIPGARRVTYFAATTQDGVGEAVTMRAGVDVDLLSFFSAASGNAQPISPADAQRVAQAQYTAMLQAPGGAATGGSTAHDSSSKRISVGTVLAAVLVVAVLALAVATPWFLRKRRGAGESVGSSGGSAVDDLCEQGG